MAALAHRIGDFFSDLWLEVELAFGKVFKKKPKQETALVQPKLEGEKEVTKVELKTKAEAKGEKKKGRTEKLPFGLRLLRLSARGRLFFFDQMATLIRSGVTLIDSLNLVRAQTNHKGLKKLYDQMIHRINAGAGFSEAMADFPHVFPKMQVALIEAGEKSGNLNTVLTELVNDMETSQDFLRKVKGAMFYPLILIFLAIALVAGMTVFVIPRVANMYEQARVDLPVLTQTVINVSHFVQNQWMILLGSIFGGLVFLWLLFAKTRFGRLSWEKFVGLFPFFGKIAKEKNLMVIAGTMSMLLKSGVLISEAFEITEKTVGNLHYQRVLFKVRHDVVMGKAVSESMGLTNIRDKKFKENKLFPLQFAQLVRIGETTGKIGEMLSRLRDNYHKSIDYKLKNISTIIEPLMIFVVALFVGSILLAVMLPFFYIGTTIS